MEPRISYVGLSLEDEMVIHAIFVGHLGLRHYYPITALDSSYKKQTLTA